uniref:N-acyl-aromatic-L-amino acid amidohydrolase n=1 Tax=Astyanax mexicanus TaxID=7994 RepID=A0A8B9HDZ9_ASTMX
GEPLPALERVAVCGGTHGNELSGVYLVRERLKKRRKSEVMEPVTVVTVMSNPRAVHRCVRYTETDLNRCFTDAMLRSCRDPQIRWIRRIRRKTLLKERRKKFCLQFVATSRNTVNMWKKILFSDQNKVTLLITLNTPSIPTVKHGGGSIMLWGEFEGGWVDVYSLVKNIDYPRDPQTHIITAAVHPDLQDRDFCLLHPGDAMFLSFSGESVRYKGKEPLYPFFINESSYYEKGVALFLARRRRVEIPSIQSSRT